MRKGEVNQELQSSWIPTEGVPVAIAKSTPYDEDDTPKKPRRSVSKPKTKIRNEDVSGSHRYKVNPKTRSYATMIPDYTEELHPTVRGQEP